MALTRTVTQMIADVRKFASVQGTTGLLRHPDADIINYLNQGRGSLTRRLNTNATDQRAISTLSFNTAANDSSYSLSSISFQHILMVQVVVDGATHWLQAFEPSEYAALTSESTAFAGKPFCYRLQGSEILILPEPTGVYAVTLWYTPTDTEFSAGADTFDTIERLDLYLIAYAARLVATKDRNWDIVNEAKAFLMEMEGEIDYLARGRDKNSPPRIVDVYATNRWGRRARR